MWRKDGTWESIHATLRKRVRVRKNRDPERRRGRYPVGQDDLRRRGAKRLLSRWEEGEKGLKSATCSWTPKASCSKPCCPQRESDGLLEGIKTLLEGADQAFPRLRHLWLEAGYRGEDKGADWVEKTLGSGAWTWWSVPESPPPRRC
jgi:hypothetical protein